MKNFENLGRLLSKAEQKMILGGNPPGGGDGPACKTSSTACTYMTPQGHVYSGTCGNTTGGPMGSTVCGCTWGGATIEDSDCNLN